MTEIFWPMLAAVLGGNLLTVMFVWAMINVSRRDEAKEPFLLYLGGAIMPLLFAAGAMYVAFGGT